MKIVIEAEPTEIAALVVALQERQEEEPDIGLTDEALLKMISRRTESDQIFR